MLQFTKTNRLVLKVVEDWARGHRDKIKSGFIEIRDSKIVLFFVPSAEQFDFDLEDALTELSGRLSSLCGGIIDIWQIPWGELDRFINLDKAVHVLGAIPEPYSASKSDRR